jgi:hypothetical protein
MKSSNSEAPAQCLPPILPTLLSRQAIGYRERQQALAIATLQKSCPIDRFPCSISVLPAIRRPKHSALFINPHADAV